MNRIIQLMFSCLLLGGCSDYVIIGLEGYCAAIYDLDYQARTLDNDVPDALDQGGLVELSWEMEFVNLQDTSEILCPCLRLQVWDLETNDRIMNTENWIHEDSQTLTPEFEVVPGEIVDYTATFRFHANLEGEVGLILFTDGEEQDQVRINVH